MKAYLEGHWENLASAWDMLLAQSPTRTVFQSYGWHQAWWETHGHEKKPFCLCCTDGGQVRGIAPLMITRRNGKRLLKFIGTGNSDYCDFLYPEERPEILAALLDGIADYAGEWDEIALDHMPGDSETIQQLKTFCEARQLYLYPYARIACPTLLFDADGRNVLEILEKKSLKRYHRHFVRDGAYDVLHLTEERDIQPILDEFFEQHIRRRRATDTPSLFNQPENREFYKKLLKHLCPQKAVVFTVLKSKGIPIAIHYGLAYDRTFLWYKPSFDLKFAKYSPGEVLLKELLEYALAHRYSEFDFTIGEEPFKMRFANHMRRNHSVKILKTPFDYWKSRGITLVREMIKI